jgi:hypothetical protein
MTEEGEAKCSVAANAVEALFGDVGDRIDRVAAQVGEFFRL